VIRNGYFSYRWSDIFNQCQLTTEEVVIKGRALDSESMPQFAPAPIEEVTPL
jgi:aspartate aminotransferase-like enzyme